MSDYWGFFNKRVSCDCPVMIAVDLHFARLIDKQWAAEN